MLGMLRYQMLILAREVSGSALVEFSALREGTVAEMIDCIQVATVPQDQISFAPSWRSLTPVESAEVVSSLS